MKLYPLFFSFLFLFAPEVWAQGDFPFDSQEIMERVKTKRQGESKLALGLDKLMRLGPDSYLADRLIIKDGMVKILAMAESDPKALRNALEAMGGNRCVVRQGVICGWFPLDKLNVLRDLPELHGVMAEFKPDLNIGATTSQGDMSMLADMARDQFGIDGSGITVGVLSDSFDALGRAANGVASGDLPGPGNPNGYTSPVEVLSEIADLSDGIDEGRGMAEIIHDVAPGANLKFFSASNGYFNFAAGILSLRLAGCDVIVDDIGYFAEPYFQDGTIAQAVDLVVADGATYFSSAGNSDRISYEAGFQGSGLNAGFGEFHDFGGGDIFQRIVVPPGDMIEYWLQWDDPSILAISPGQPEYTGPAPEADYDLYLIDAQTGDLVDLSNFDNPGDLLPIEFVSYQNNTDQPVELDLMIVRFSGPDRYLKYIDRGSGILPAEYNTFSGTSVGHSMASSGYGIAASAYYNTSEFGEMPSLVNGYSSVGGVPILLDPQGFRLSAPEIRQQPYLTGPDGVNTTDFPPLDIFGSTDIEGDGFQNFFGTSASAPHVAGAAALLLQQSGGSLAPMEIGQLLADNAEDMDDPFTPGFDEGFDFATGYGLVNVAKSIAALAQEELPFRFVLWDANHDTPLYPIRPGAVLDQRDLPLRLTLQVLVAGSDPGPVLLELEGPILSSRTERSAPFTLFGNKGTDVNGRFFPQGSYLVRATTQRGATYAVPFTITGPDPQIIGLELIDAENDVVIGPLTEGMHIDRSAYPGDLSIRLLANNMVGSVDIALEGPIAATRRENRAPYTLFGNDGFDFFGQPFPAGAYSLRARPYARNNLLGEAGEPLQVNFTVSGAEPALALALREDAGANPNPFSSQEAVNQFSVFPNPGKGPFTVLLPRLERGETLQVWLSDVNGRRIDLGRFQPEQTRQFQFHPGNMNLVPGIYFLHARSPDREFAALRVALQP